VAGLRSAAEQRARQAEHDRAAANARAEEQRRKRRWQFATASLIALAMAGGILGLSLYLRAQAKANADLAAKNEELSQANERERERFSLAIDSIGLLTGNIGQNMLLQQKEFAGLRTKLLKGAADFYGRLEMQLRDRIDPASQAVLGRAYFELGDLTDHIASKEEALAVHRKSLAIRKGLAASMDAPVESRLEVARSLGRIGWLLFDTGNPADATNAFEEQISIASELEAGSATDEIRLVLAQGQLGLGNLLSRTGKGKEALGAYEKALTTHQKLAEAHPDQASFQSDLARIHFYLSRIYILLGKPTEALSSVLAARKIQQTLANNQPSTPEFQFQLVRSLHEVGWQLYLLGRTDEGLASVREEKAIIQNLVDTHPAVTEFQFQLAESYSETGELLYTTGKESEGLASVFEAQAIIKKLVKAHPKVAKYRIELMYTLTSGADALRRLGRLKEAEASCEAAIAEADALVREQPTIANNRSVMAWSLRVLGLTHLAAGDVSLATKEVRQAIELLDGLAIRSGELWFETACCHAALMELAGREGSGVTAAEKQTQADQTMALLKKAMLMGYRAETFQTEATLNALRERDDFRKLIAEIEATKVDKVKGP
jgi:tetratricopeptide (TPR) repeat protein